jgi:hypothetical protein
VIVFVEMMTLSLFRAWEEWINVILGAWLVICSWLLDISYPPAKTNFVIVGLLVLVLAVYEIWEARRQSRNQS